MAEHTITLELPEVEIGNVDAVVKIRKGKNLIGRLKISKGAIEWTPKGKQDRGTVSKTWKDFDKLMRSAK